MRTFLSWTSGGNQLLPVFSRTYMVVLYKKQDGEVIGVRSIFAQALNFPEPDVSCYFDGVCLFSYLALCLERIRSSR
jgi:hypothetical protein